MPDLSTVPTPIALAALLRPGERALRIPGASRYWATDRGRVFSTARGLREIRPYAKPSKRYLQVDVWFDGPDGTTRRRVVFVHVLVMSAFVGPRPTTPGVAYDVDHVDGDRQNNRIANLRYIPKAENVGRAMRSAARDGRHPTAKLSPADVWTLRCRAHDEGTAPVVADAADELGMSVAAVRAAISGRSWRWVPDPSDRPGVEALARSLGVDADEARRLLDLSPFVRPAVRVIPFRSASQAA
ncbi:HNH endonuclease signature motif containing protein [Rubrivirga marina]|uniref:HNH nuclease domain-containing protein n=1 Tax=Rubrivirga marina TaxID=1196024 RepID=A0A271J0V8_9BACT|nr:HNH endonuclease signature motif containing protein [Rubrivirga marina]PAP76369.1 hypothetical protein BSZ37_07895 [Rubrivirga marina]